MAYLDRAYAAKAILRRPGADNPEAYGDVLAALRDAMTTDAALTALARAEAARLAPVNDGRCVITRAHKAFLREALTGETE